MEHVPYPSSKRIDRYASLRARMSDPAVGRKYFAIKGARGTHKAILAQGRKLCAEANAATKAKRERELNVGKQWRYGQSDLTGI
jgi:hypothetical protein